MSALDQLPAEVEPWARGLFSRATDLRIARLSGGANNLVFLGDDSVRRLILKVYPQAGAEGERRFRAESEFLALAGEAAPTLVAKVLATDRGLRAVALEELIGAPVSEHMPPTAQDVAAAARLLTLINQDQALAKARVTSTAADGFRTLTEHRRDIERRVSELTIDHLTAPERADATALIAETRQAFDRASQGLDDALNSKAIDDRLDDAFLCVSPSDFGFHNAVRTTSGVKFFDFEFAGWDDPTKCLIDFFLQPRIPTPVAHETTIESALATCIPVGLLQRRAAALRPLLAVKWLTIVLAVLRPNRLADMLAVRGEASRDILIAERLIRARRILSKVS